MQISSSTMRPDYPGVLGDKFKKMFPLKERFPEQSVDMVAP